MVEIKDISGKTRFSTPINNGAKGKFTLMKEDYIILPFSVPSPIPFKLGDYADLTGILDESLGGKLAKVYEITDLQKPTYNTSTGGYDYQLRLDAYYWKWKNKIFKYTPEKAGNEASWSLTASLDVHLGVVLRNLKALGYTYKGTEFTFSIDSTVEDKAVAITYDNINILDALFTLASKEYYNCDCWITDNVIHFGRNEFGNAVKIERGVEASSVTRSESQGTYATRIFAFGSTKNIPTNYRPTDEQAVVNGVVQKRLMLPIETPYIDAYEGMSEEEAIEDVVIFDDVFPRRVGELSDVHTRTEEVENEDGTKETVTYYRYKDTGLEFKEEYIIEGQELKIQFQSGKLNGMEFGVIFNPDTKDESRGMQLWEIVRNENYGRMLPDEIMFPANGDKYILSGFDIQLVSDLYIPEAEQELKEKAVKYAQIAMKDDGTYPTTLRSSWVKEDLISRTFEFGQRINLVDDTYFENGRISRVLGWELKLDIPWDSPVYTIGESMPYSRIQEIEDKVDALTYKGQTYAGNGSGVYIIRTNDLTAPSDSNVFSALRSLATFLRKDKADETKYLIKFFAGLEAGLYAEGGKDGSKLHKSGLAELGSMQVNGDSEFRGNLSSQEFISGFLTGRGWAIQMKKIINAAGVEEYKAVGELDDLIVRGTLRVFEFVVSQLLGENDNRIFTAMLEVDHYDTETGKVYLDTQEGKFYNPFRKDDYIMVQQYNGMPSAENNHYVTKQYELIVTAIGMEGDLAWVTFKNFTTSLEGGTPESLIVRKDTFVRVDNLSDPDRKGIIQMMTVGSNTPYVDVSYGLKTDPSNALKVRIGKLEGIYNSLFGWLKSYGAYLLNVYAVGEYRQRNTGEDFDTKIEMLKEQFLSEYKKQYYDITDEDNFLKNTAFLNDLEYWTVDSGTQLLSLNNTPLFVNRSTLSIKQRYVGIEEHEGKNMLRISNNTIKQLNADIKKPGTHLELDESDEEVYVPDTLYLSLKVQFVTSGTLTAGFRDSAHSEKSLSFVEEEVAAIDPNQYKILQWSGTWDGYGDFELGYTGDMYVSLLSLTTDPLANFEITTSTKFRQTNTTIGMYGEKIDNINKTVTDLGIEIDAANENIRLYAEKVDNLEETTTNLGVEIDAANEQIKLYAEKVDSLEKTTTSLGLDIDAVDERVTLYAQKTTENEQSIAKLEVKVDGISSEVISEIDGNTIVSKINQTATTVSIDASKINLNGVVTANNTFRIDTDGTFSATAGKIGGFTIDAGRLYWKGKDYFDQDARSIKIGASTSTLEGLVDISFNASSIGRFGVKVIGSNMGGACIFASTKESGYTTPASPHTYAAWLDGDVRCTGKLSANICAATEFFAATSIVGGTIEGYKGVTFGFNDYDLDSVRFQVQNGLIVGVKKE